MLSRTGFCLLSVALMSAPVRGDQSLKDTLVAQETKLIDAIGMNDDATIAGMLANESYSITASRGRRGTDEVIHDLEHLKYASYEISDAVAIPLTSDVAILSYTFSYVAEAASPATTVYATSVWKRTGDEWDSVFYQETPSNK